MPGIAEVVDDRRGDVDQGVGHGRELVQGRRRVALRPAMRVWVDLTNSPHPLVMRPIVERLRARRATSVSVTARDFAQTVELAQRARPRADGDRPPPRRAPGGEGARARLALARARALGAPRGASTWPSATAQTTSRVAAAALRIPSRDDVRLRVGDASSTTSTAASRAWSSSPDAIPPARLDRYGARGKLRTYPGLKEEYYLADFEPDDRGARRARPRRRASRSSSCARRRTSRSTTASRTSCSRGVLERVRGTQTVVLPRIALAARGAASRRRLHRPRARDRRAVADRARRPGDQRGRHDEPRGGGARHAGLDDLRGPPRRGRRAPDRAGADAPARARRADRAGASASATAARGCAATPRCSPSCCADRRAAPRLSTPASRIKPLQSLNAPTASLGGLSAASPFAAAARGRRGAGRARVLPGVLAALRRASCAARLLHRLLDATLPWVVLGTVAILALSRVYQRRWRYVRQRDIELLVRSLVVATVLLVSIVVASRIRCIAIRARSIAPAHVDGRRRPARTA